MNSFSDMLFVYVGLTILVAFPILIFMIYLKRRKQRMRIHREPEGVMKGTRADLERSEAALQLLPIDIRDSLVETHELYDRYQTHRGYSNVYMEALSKAIRDLGIDCEFIFQATLPMGAADAIVEPQGVFELYVVRAKMSEAKKVIPPLIGSMPTEVT